MGCGENKPVAISTFNEIDISMKTLRSFGYAWEGLKHAFLTQNNFRLHSLSAVLALFMGFLFRISEPEWLAVLICIALVSAAELFNTALEKLCDMVHTGHHPVIKAVKDLSAAAVLISALASLATGGIIFIPKLILFFKTI